METWKSFQQRRRLLGLTYSRTLFVIPSGQESKRSHSVNYRFKAASDFTYLCGLDLSGAILLILGERTYLMFDKKDDHIWGEDQKITESDSLLTADIAIQSLDQVREIVRSHLSEFDRIAVSLNRDQTLDHELLATLSYDRELRTAKGRTISVCDSRPLVGTARLVKSNEEILHLREAGARSSIVHTQIMKQSLIGKTEIQISNQIEAGFLLQDMRWTAYETIVGSGQRSTLLHARPTNRVVQDGDLILVDAGGEWNGYCSDITRVLPAGRRFSNEQKEIYQCVLTAQKAAIAAVKPEVTLQEVHKLTQEVLIEELLRLGLPAEDVRGSIGRLMPHSTSHWLGMDVHDPSPYVDDAGAFLRLGIGMCFTIEPGLYFRDGDDFRKYQGIGVRIEDDVVVTEEGCELLSAVPKEVEEIEELRARAKN